MKQKIVIGCPTGGTVMTRFAQSILALQKYEQSQPNDKYEVIDIVFSSGLYIQDNRNKLVLEAQKLGADWLLQIDSDHSFQPDFLRMLMRTADKETRPIMVGLYTNIGDLSEGAFQVVDCIYAETPNGQYRVIKPPDDLQPFEVDAAGAGLMLTHLSVFDKLESPWFWLAMFRNEDGSEQLMNEDLAFCRTARIAGFHIWCDPMVEGVHWKTIPMLPSTMRSFISKSIEIRRAMDSVDTDISGFIDVEDLQWLYIQAGRMDSIVEIGCWKGRSTSALLKGCSTGRVYAVDHFKGSPSELTTNHSEVDGDNIYQEFMKNVGRYMNLTVLKMDSLEAAKQFESKSVDMVFIDGDHEYAAVKADIEAWLPKCKKMICGHDIDLPSVSQAVREMFLDWKTGSGTMWYVPLPQ